MTVTLYGEEGESEILGIPETRGKHAFPPRGEAAPAPLAPGLTGQDRLPARAGIELSAD